MKQIADHEWMFVEPWELGEVYDQFDYGCELLENGKESQAEKLFNTVISKVPIHIDALHHLAIILDGKEKSEEARQLWTKGVEIGRSVFSTKFTYGDHLEWGWLENRPFLRCLHGLATATLDEGNIAKATELFEELLSYNPDDNQGVRELLMEMYLEQNNLVKALDLCKWYPNDMMAGMLYGYPLVLFKLGKQEQASKKLIKVVKESPKIAKELFKKSHKKPQSDMPGHITCGGWDEAYYYWKRFGRFWDKKALEWLRNVNECYYQPLTGLK
jgi:tetratricopeptide (TPR) repeat protein